MREYQMEEQAGTAVIILVAAKRLALPVLWPMPAPDASEASLHIRHLVVLVIASGIIGRSDRKADGCTGTPYAKN